MKEYKAFISYSHKDEVIAGKLHRYLERFRIPENLHKDKNHALPGRLYPVFRDREELPSSADLGRQISTALEHSEFLVVICSPKSAKSRWVNEEILHFKRLGKGDNILALIIDGEPNAQDEGDSTNSTECFPESLKFNLQSNGTLDKSRQIEPIAADFRIEGDGQRNSFMKIAAGLMRVGFDELYRREIKRRQRIAYGIAFMSLAILAVVGSLAGIAVKNAREARDQRNLAENRLFEIDSKNKELESQYELVESEKNRAEDSAREANEQRVIAESESERAEAETIRAGNEKEEARHQLYISSILQTHMYLDEYRIELGRETLWAAPEEQSDWEWGNLALQLDPRLLVLEGHELRVNHATFSPDGSRICTVSSDNTIRIWDAEYGTILNIIKTEDPIRACFSPDGNQVLVASGDFNHISIWNVDSGEKLHESSEVACIPSPEMFSTDGSRVVLPVSDNSARVLDTISWETILILGPHDGFVTGCSYSPDETRIVTTASDGSSRIWDSGTGEQLVAMESKGMLIAPVFSPDSTLLLITANDFDQQDFSLEIWDGRTGELRHSLEGHLDLIRPSEFSPDGSRIVSASADGTARVWDSSSGEQLILFGEHNWDVYSASFNPAGNRIISTSGDGTIREWDSKTGEEYEVTRPTGEAVESVEFSPDGTGILAACGRSAHLLFSEEGPFSRNGMKSHVLKGGGFPSRTDFLSPDGRLYSTVSYVNTIAIWDASDGQLLHELNGHTKGLNATAFSPDSTLIASASDDGTAKIWDVRNGMLLQTFRGHESEVVSVAFSSDGTMIITASKDGTARIWDTASTSVQILPGSSDSICSDAILSPDNSIVATAYRNAVIRLWNRESAEEIVTIRAPDSSGEFVYDLTYSPDGRQLSAALTTGTIEIFDTAAGGINTTLKGHERYVINTEFSPSGKRLITTSADYSIRIWDTQSGKELQMLRSHNEKFLSASFSPDGRQVLALMWDGYIREWNAAPWHLEDLPETGGDFTSIEEERRMRLVEWKREYYLNWLQERIH